VKYHFSFYTIENQRTVIDVKSETRKQESIGCLVCNRELRKEKGNGMAAGIMKVASVTAELAESQPYLPTVSS
jgi:hypothetical protein